MTISPDDRRALDALGRQLKTILPEEYQETYEELQPTPMRSAGLKYDRDGNVAWNEIWGAFCDLAMAGGPPHKGTLLEPASEAEIEAHADRYDEVVREICRGIEMVTDLEVRRAPLAGWIRVACLNESMAGWLGRAIVMENVAARSEETKLDLPASPFFRIDKEIKNVVTVIAKTSHYWLGHMSRAQRRAIAELFTGMAQTAPLIEPALRSDGAQASDEHQLRCTTMAGAIHRATGLQQSGHRYAGWLGVECPSVRAAIWMMRALVVSNILSRREGTALFVPVNPASDPHGDIAVRSVLRLHRLASVRGLC
jgi:hypothetical protein